MEYMFDLRGAAAGEVGVTALLAEITGRSRSASCVR